jgi:hypothetical protein
MKRAIYLAFIAGTILTACSTPDKKREADKTTPIDTTTAKAVQTTNIKTKLDKTKIPKKVTELFYVDYPATTVSDERWYGYPTFDTSDWYDYNPYLFANADPDTYLVEFTMDSTTHRAIYTKTGEKLAIHTIISDLPATVSAAIKKSAYKTWAIDKEKEEIFKDKDSDKLKVYKVKVETGSQAHILYFLGDGRLMKDKKVS